MGDGDLIREENIQLAQMIRSMEIQSEKERQRVKEQNKVVKKMALEKRQMNKQLEHLEELRKRGFMDKSLAEQKAQAERMKADLQVFKARLVERDTEKAVLQKKKTVIEGELIQEKRIWMEQKNKIIDELANEVNNTCIETEKYEAEKQQGFVIKEKLGMLQCLLGLSEECFQAIMQNEASELERQQQLLAILQDSIVNTQKQSRSNEQVQKKRQSKIHSYQVKDVAQIVKYKLIQGEIAYERLESALFSREMLNLGEVAVSEMLQQFQRPPFLMPETPDLVLLSRYLVEDNEEAFVLVDMDRSQSIECIRSIFKTLIGPYSLLDPVQELALFLSIAHCLNRFTSILRENFQMLIQNRKAEDQNLGNKAVSYEELHRALLYIEANFSAAQSDYIALHMFICSQSLSSVFYEEFLLFFEPEGPKWRALQLGAQQKKGVEG